MATGSAIIYARLSKDDRTLTIPSQLRRCREFCESRGLSVLDELKEDERSASKYATRGRPRYLEALEMLTDGRANAIVAINIDRLHRQPKELEALVDLAESGLMIYTLEGEYDLTKGDDRFRARLDVSFAARESDEKSRRIRAKHEDLALAGRWAGGTTPYGFTPDRDAPGGLALNVEQADRLRQWTTDIVAGKPLGQIVDELNTEGVPTLKGARWTVPTLRGMVTADRIAGQRVHKGKIYPALWPEIITSEELETVRRVIATRGGKRTPENWRTYLLTGGVALCGREGCGVPLVAQRRGNRVAVYKCSARHGGCGKLSVIADRLEDTVAEMTCLAVEGLSPVSPSAPTDTYDPADDQTLLIEIMEERTNRKVSFDEWEAAQKIITARIEAHSRASAADPLANYRGQPDALAQIWDDLTIKAQRVIVEAVMSNVRVMPATRRGRVWDPERIKPDWR